MKILFLSTIVMFSIIAESADCKKKVDSSKIMIFVDTNESDLEIDTASIAACDRGQKLVVVPQNYKMYATTANQVKKASASLNKCYKASNSAEIYGNGKCNDFFLKRTKAEEAHIKFMSSQKSYEIQLREELENIRKNKGTLESFTISGHNGGGAFGGAKSNMTKGQIGKIMKDYSDINQVKSALLLGCYTAVPREILQWSEIFPNLKMMAGYDGSAPLAVRPEGHQYLYDLLVQEKRLSATADEKRLAAILDKNFKSINLLHASMYLKPGCDINPQEKSFYYGAKNGGKELREFDIKECLNEKEKIKNITLTLNKYRSGEIDTPADTSKGELRELYNNTRRLEHCNNILGSNLDSNAAFGLLFFNGYKSNFANFYSSNLVQVEKELASLTPEVLLKNREAVAAGLDAEINDNLKMIEKFESFNENKKLYVEYKKEELKKATEDYKKLISTPEMKRLIEKYPALAEGSQADSGAIAQEDLKDFMQLHFKKTELESMKFSLINVNENPNMFLSVERNNLKYKQSSLDRNKQKIMESILTVEELKKVWIPTKENLSTKSRKDIQENLHNISGLMANPTMSPELRNSLGWTLTVASRHLQFLDAPFSWHEFTGQTEAPVSPTKLAGFKYEMNSFNGSYGGFSGIGMGGIGTGGIGTMGTPPEEEDTQTEADWSTIYPNGGY